MGTSMNPCHNIQFMMFLCLSGYKYIEMEAIFTLEPFGNSCAESTCWALWATLVYLEISDTLPVFGWLRIGPSQGSYGWFGEWNASECDDSVEEFALDLAVLGVADVLIGSAAFLARVRNGS